jgi:hypothetical protein
MSEPKHYIASDVDLLCRKIITRHGSHCLMIRLGREPSEQAAILDTQETRNLLAWLKEQFPEDA